MLRETRASEQYQRDSEVPRDEVGGIGTGQITVCVPRRIRKTIRRNLLKAATNRRAKARGGMALQVLLSIVNPRGRSHAAPEAASSVDLGPGRPRSSQATAGCRGDRAPDFGDVCDGVVSDASDDGATERSEGV